MQELDLDRKVFLEEDISAYMRWDFLPLYSVQGIVVIALYKMTDGILQYLRKNYLNFQLLYTSKSTIHKILYRHLHQDYQHAYSAHHINYRLLLIILLAVFFLGSNVFIINCIYLASNIFKLLTVLLSICRPQHQDICTHIDFPIYTVLIPIKNEKKETIRRLIESLAALDYPAECLDIKLIVEEEDIAQIEAMNLSYDVIKVPYFLPQTKAKACNYALRFAKGQYVSVYDADDRPHPQQLKKVVETFNSDNDIACVQAPLNYYNYNANYLTKFFALEYSYLFDFALHGINKLQFPILLGGSSNHFRLEVLRELGGWDPYNVTEDADVGIKLRRQGRKVAILSSHATLEEAPIKIKSWIKQRARWIKGFITTYLVHARSPREMVREGGWRSLVGVQLLLLFPIIIYIFSPIVWIKYLLLPHEQQLFLWINVMLYAAINLLTGILSMRVRKLWHLMPYALLMPLYYILHSLASYRALWQLFVNPHKWDKTEHCQ